MEYKRMNQGANICPVNKVNTRGVVLSSSLKGTHRSLRVEIVASTLKQN